MKAVGRVPREKVSCLVQEFSRYYDTVEGNIFLGDIGRRADSARAARSLEMAAAADFVNSLPRGSKSALGGMFEGGAELSVGQWQRIAIARCLYREADIYLFDEPGSALDLNTEMNLIADVAELAKNRIVLYASHRVQMVRQADWVFVLKGGEVVEQGRPSDLFGRPGSEIRRVFREQEGDLNDGVGPLGSPSM